MPNEWPRVAIYARASLDKGDRRISVDRQVARCREKAEALFPLGGNAAARRITIYQDNNLSASNPEVTRPSYEALIKAIRRGEVDELVVHEQSRLTRQPGQWDDLVVTLSRAKITRIHTVQQGVIGIEPGNRLLGRIMSAVDAEETERLKARMLAMHAQLVVEGRPPGGRFFGYRRVRDDGDKRSQLVVEAEEAEVIRRITDELLAGHSASSVAKRLNDDGIPTPRGGSQWRDTTVRRSVQPHVAGLRIHHGKVTPAKWDPIISLERYEALAQMLGSPTLIDVNGKRRARNGGPRPPRPKRWLLVGLIRCERCKARMRTQRQSRAAGQFGYQCLKVGGDDWACQAMTLLPAELVEEVVVEDVLTVIESNPLAAARLSATDDPEIAITADELAAAEARLKRAGEMFGAGEITEQEWEAMRDPAKARADAARARLQTLAPAEVQLPPAKLIRDAWSDLPLRARQEVLSRLLEAVWIKPSVRPIPKDPRTRVAQRIRLEYREGLGA